MFRFDKHYSDDIRSTSSSKSISKKLAMIFVSRPNY